MNSLLEQLHDIDGLDTIGIWPLAMGWWIAIGITLLALMAIFYLIAKRIAYKRSWKNDTQQKLYSLEKNLSPETAKDTVIALSEYMRRIALKRFSRKECASLIGNAWLKWLKEHDEHNFDWAKKGSLMVKAPYAPISTNFCLHEIKDLIDAAKGWVR